MMRPNRWLFAVSCFALACIFASCRPPASSSATKDSEVASEPGTSTPELPEGWVLQEMAAVVPFKDTHVAEDIRVIAWTDDKNGYRISGKCVLQVRRKPRNSSGETEWLLASVYQYPTKGHWLLSETGMMVMKEGEALCIRTSHTRSYHHPPSEEEIQEFKRDFSW